MRTDLRGRTDLADLHGANRLAGNSLVECIVFAHAAARNIAQHPQPATHALPARHEGRALYRQRRRRDYAPPVSSN